MKLYLHTFFYLGTRWAFYPQGKSPWYSLNRRLGGPQRRSGRGGEGKIPNPY